PARAVSHWKRNKKVAVHSCRALTRFFALFHEVRLMRKSHNSCRVKRRSWEHTEPRRASNLFVTLPPPIILLRVRQRLQLHHQVIAHLRRGWVRLRGTSRPSPPRGAGVGHDAIAYHMIAPGAGAAASPARPAVLILRQRRGGIRLTGKPARLHL